MSMARISALAKDEAVTTPTGQFGLVGNRRKGREDSWLVVEEGRGANTKHENIRVVRRGGQRVGH